MQTVMVVPNKLIKTQQPNSPVTKLQNKTLQSLNTSHDYNKNHMNQTFQTQMASTAANGFGLMVTPNHLEAIDVSGTNIPIEFRDSRNYTFAGQ